MRHAIPYAASAAVLLFGATFFFEGSAQAAGADAGAGKTPVTTDPPARKRPVVVAQPEADEEDAAAEETAEAAPAAPTGRRRPVIAPGTEVNLPPPPVTQEPAAAEAPKADTPAAPAAPPAPLEFQGLPVIEDAEVAPKGPIENPAEIRTVSRIGNFQYTFFVRPGRPDPGTPVELIWRIHEILHIPDPLFGDRKPIETVNLHARITGPEGNKLYQAHALEAPGTFGLHFTPSKSGSYQVQLLRADGRSGHELQSTVWVGVEPPAASTVRDASSRGRAPLAPSPSR